MLLKRYSLPTLLVVFTSLVMALCLPVTTASATSSFDDTIQLTDARVSCEDSNSNFHMYDLSNEYFDILYNANSTFASLMDAAMLDGQGWVLNSFVSGDYKDLSVFVTTSPPGSVQFSSQYYTNGYAYLTSSMRATVWCTGWANGAPTGFSTDFNTSPGNREVAYWTGNYGYKAVFMNAPISYPGGYEGATIPSTYVPPPAKYVAMGDSFSSGEGNSPFESGTDQSGSSENRCHRSSDAYPRLISNDPDLSLWPLSFVACSGASTSNVLNGGSGAGAWDEDSQIDSVTEDTEVVTLGIGGNDVGFREFAVACTVSLCNFSTTAYSTIIDHINNDLPGQLEDVFEAITAEISLSTDVYVIGYPHIAPAEMPTGPNSACWPLNGQLDDPDPDLNDGATVRYVVAQLNETIASSVAELNDSRFIYVDPNASGSPFIDHDWCKEDRYFDIVTYNSVEHSFHPNEDGQAAYAAIVKDAMN